MSNCRTLSVGARHCGKLNLHAAVHYFERGERIYSFDFGPFLSEIDKYRGSIFSSWFLACRVQIQIWKSTPNLHHPHLRGKKSEPCVRRGMNNWMWNGHSWRVHQTERDRTKPRLMAWYDCVTWKLEHIYVILYASGGDEKTKMLSKIILTHVCRKIERRKIDTRIQPKSQSVTVRYLIRERELIIYA